MRKLAPTYDLIVVGAGPAGSTCAWFAARAGCRVLLVDGATFPRDKICGDALTRTKVLPLLHEMGLAEAFRQLPSARCEQLLLGAPSGATVVLSGPAAANGFALSNHVCLRRDFDQWLLRQLEGKADVAEGFKVTGLVWEHGRVGGVRGVESVSGAPRTIRGRLVIGADGVNSVVARQAGLEPRERLGRAVALRGYFAGVPLRPNLLELYLLKPLRPGYLWVFPCHDGLANVGIIVLSMSLGRERMRLPELFWSLTEGHPQLARRFRTATLQGQLRGWPVPCFVPSARRSADGVMLIGDAAWLVDPLTGEGIGNAMLSGKLAAETAAEAIRAGDVSAMALQRYDARLHRCLGRELCSARMLQWVLRQAWLTDLAVRTAAGNHAVGRMLRAVCSLPGGKRSLWSWQGLRQVVRAIGSGDEAAGEPLEPRAQPGVKGP